MRRHVRRCSTVYYDSVAKLFILSLFVERHRGTLIVFLGIILKTLLELEHILFERFRIIFKKFGKDIFGELQLLLGTHSVEEATLRAMDFFMADRTGGNCGVGTGLDP